MSAEVNLKDKITKLHRMLEARNVAKLPVLRARIVKLLVDEFIRGNDGQLRTLLGKFVGAVVSDHQGRCELLDAVSDQQIPAMLLLDDVCKSIDMKLIDDAMASNPGADEYFDRIIAYKRFVVDKQRLDNATLNIIGGLIERKLWYAVFKQAKADGWSVLELSRRTGYSPDQVLKKWRELVANDHTRGEKRTPKSEAEEEAKSSSKVIPGASIEMSEYQQEIFEKVHWKSYHKLKKCYAGMGIAIDEDELGWVYPKLLETFIRCVKEFEADRGAKFNTYFTRAATYMVTDMLRKERSFFKNIKKNYLDTVRYNDDDEDEGEAYA